MHIYKSGIVYTQDGIKESFVTDGGRFIYVGDNEGAGRYKEPDVEIIDLKGKFVCAGFNDSHMHLLNYGYSMSCANLSQYTDSIVHLTEGFRQWAQENPVQPGQWICGRGFNQDYFQDEHRLPCRTDLDKVDSTHPVIAVRTCGHLCVVNSAALRRMGLEPSENAAAQPDVHGNVSPQEPDACGNGALQGPDACGNAGVQEMIRAGLVDVDACGRFLGIFRENAMNFVFDHMPRHTLTDVKRMLLAAAHAVNGFGVTSVQSDDFKALPSVDDHMVRQAYEELAASGELTVRVNEQCQFDSARELQTFLDGICGREHPYSGNGDTWFKCGPLKIVGDGSLGARTAYLLDPYADDPTTRGIDIYSFEGLKEMMTLARDSGMPVCVHAIGDGMMDRVLRAFEDVLGTDAGISDHRCGVVHCQIMRPEHYEKFRELRLHAYIQSVFLDYDTRIVCKRVGNDRAASSYNFKRFLELGVSVSNGSDCPVEVPAPMRGIQCAVTRSSLDGTSGPYLPQQVLTVAEALNTYTTGGARASFEEHLKGDIKEGMLADFVVLDKNPMETEVDHLSDIQVLETWVDGKKVYPM